MKKKGIHLLVAAAVICLLVVMASGSALAQAKKYEVEISGLWTGTNPYTIAVYWAELINKNSKIVKAIAREGRGPAVDMKTLIMKPEKRKSLVFFQVEDEVWAAKQQIGDWKNFAGKYDLDNFRHIAFGGFTVDALMSTNPKIKTLKDMEGKSTVISNVSGASSKAKAFMEIFQAAGVKPKYQYLGMNAMTDALRDGTVDVIHGGVNPVGAGKWEPSPYLNELFAMKTVYAISIDKAILEKMKKATGHPGTVVTIPAGQIGKDQKDPTTALGKCMNWGVDASMPDEVVMEILRVYVENIDKFQQLSPAARVITKKTVAAMEVPEARVHPAAVKFYKQNKIPMVSLKEAGLIQ
jgi:TRAP transporter TAXI family solute receptor